MSILGDILKPKPLDLKSGPESVNAASRQQHDQQYSTFGSRLKEGLGSGHPGRALIGALVGGRKKKSDGGGA